MHKIQFIFPYTLWKVTLFMQPFNIPLHPFHGRSPFKRIKCFSSLVFKKVLQLIGYAIIFLIPKKMNTYCLTRANTLLHFGQKFNGRIVGFSTLPCRMYDTMIFFKRRWIFVGYPTSNSY